MKNIVIIGNSAAAIAAIEGIRSRDKDSRIAVITDENYPAYCRCLISYYLAGEVKEDKILYRPQEFYKENNVELILNKKVSRIDPKKNRAICEDKTQLDYDTLLIATGSRPKFPEIKGIKKKGVFGFRTIEDAKNIEGLLPVAKTAYVLGGGLIGLKAAYALKKRNIEVKVVIKSKQVLSQMLDAEAANFVQKKLEDHGLEIILGQDASEIIGNGDLKAVKLDSGKVGEASLVIVGKGVSPNIELVKESQVKFNEGILANNLMQTNIENIYTAGDVCEALDLVTGTFAINALWPVAIRQGRIAGINMAGGSINYEGSLGMNAIEFFGLPVISLGLHRIPAEKSGQYEELKALDRKANTYKRFILKENFLVGAILAGDIKNSGLFLRIIRERINVSDFKGKLMSENFGYPDIADFISEDISYGAGYLINRRT